MRGADRAHFICADARHLPLRKHTSDLVFSYSVLQQVPREDVCQVVSSVDQVLKLDGLLSIQMPNRYGLRCLYRWMRRGFCDGKCFEVRYWTPDRIRQAFSVLGSVRLNVGCFFGIGLRPSDAEPVPFTYQILIALSERLRAISRRFPGVSTFADSLYVELKKRAV
jgi:hypothetical protein